MKTYSNTMALAELWDEKKAYGVNAKALLKNIKAATKVKSTKKNPEGIKHGEVTLVMPEEFIGTELKDAYGGDDLWLMFRIKKEDWDSKLAELKKRETVEK
jgi:tRNA(Glu) U13 pseudouridine synthase TruD